MSELKPNVIDLAIQKIVEDEEISLEEAVKEFVKRSDHVYHMTKPESPGHQWVDRGAVWSCEDAGHPNHRHFKKK